MIKKLQTINQMIKRLGVYNTVTYYIDVIKNREERKKYFEEEKRISSKLPDQLRICFQVSGGLEIILCLQIIWNILEENIQKIQIKLISIFRWGLEVQKVFLIIHMV